MTDKKLSKKEMKLTEDIAGLTADLQRTRADFENFRKRIETEKEQARQAGKTSAVLKLLPVIDNIERAIAYMPEELHDNTWANSVAGLVKHLDKSLEGLGLKRIDAKPGTTFDPTLHEAIQFDDVATGEHEVVAEELQAGYLQDGVVVRPSLIKATRK